MRWREGERKNDGEREREESQKWRWVREKRGREDGREREKREKIPKPEIKERIDRKEKKILVRCTSLRISNNTLNISLYHAIVLLLPY